MALGLEVRCFSFLCYATALLVLAKLTNRRGWPTSWFIGGLVGLLHRAVYCLRSFSAAFAAPTDQTGAAGSGHFHLCKTTVEFHYAYKRLVIANLPREARISAARPKNFVFAVGDLLAWIVTGPLFGFSDTWQLVINTARGAGGRAAISLL